MNLKKKISEAINSCSRENKSNTPDMILAEYLIDCLNAFEKTSKARERWYGISSTPDRGTVQRKKSLKKRRSLKTSNKKLR